MLFIAFALGFLMNPAVSLSGVPHPRWFPLIGVFFSAVFLLMLFLATPKKDGRGNGQKKPEEPGG